MEPNDAAIKSQAPGEMSVDPAAEDRIARAKRLYELAKLIEMRARAANDYQTITDAIKISHLALTLLSEERASQTKAAELSR